MTHYEITMDNDVTRYIHCDITMNNAIAMCTYHVITMHNNIAMSLFYYVLLLSIDSSTVQKQEQVHGDHLWISYSLYMIAIFHLCYALMKYLYTKQFM